MNRSHPFFLILLAAFLPVGLGKAKAFSPSGCDSCRSVLRFGISIGPGWYGTKLSYFSGDQTLLVFAHQIFVEKKVATRFAGQLGFRYTSLNPNISFNREADASHFSVLRVYSLESSLRFTFAEDKEFDSRLYLSVGSGIQWLSPVFYSKADSSTGPVVSFSPSLAAFGSVGVEFPLGKDVHMRIDLRFLGARLSSKTENLVLKTTTYRQELLRGGQLGFQVVFR